MVEEFMMDDMLDNNKGHLGTIERRVDHHTPDLRNIITTAPESYAPRPEDPRPCFTVEVIGFNLFLDGREIIHLPAALRHQPVRRGRGIAKLGPAETIQEFGQGGSGRLRVAAHGICFEPRPRKCLDQSPGAFVISVERKVEQRQQILLFGSQEFGRQGDAQFPDGRIGPVLQRHIVVRATAVFTPSHVIDPGKAHTAFRSAPCISCEIAVNFAVLVESILQIIFLIEIKLLVIMIFNGTGFANSTRKYALLPLRVVLIFKSAARHAETPYEPKHFVFDKCF